LKVGKWIIGSSNSESFGIPDKAVIEKQKVQVTVCLDTDRRLVGLTAEGTKVWTLEQEFKEMKGHLGGRIRSIYGREMLDAKKMAILEDMKLRRF
jgi:hypothetical protein